MIFDLIFSIRLLRVSPLPYYTADGKTAATVITILRVDNCRGRSQIVTVHSRNASIGPPVARSGTIEDVANRAIVAARTEKVGASIHEERRAPSSSSGFTQLRSAPLGFEYTGYYNSQNGFPADTSSAGHYWSRTAETSNSIRFLYFTSNIATTGSGPRGNGFAVRCVAR